MPAAAAPAAPVDVHPSGPAKDAGIPGPADRFVGIVAVAFALLLVSGSALADELLTSGAAGVTLGTAATVFSSLFALVAAAVTLAHVFGVQRQRLNDLSAARKEHAASLLRHNEQIRAVEQACVTSTVTLTSMDRRLGGMEAGIARLADARERDLEAAAQREATRLAERVDDLGEAGGGCGRPR